ncbi:molybdopterin cofactor-binding domain-containing protein [Novosphingobium sp. BL-8H]|uniref:molybdopterin cofactor-binding domain-containing protein n=1 Tax=Novosphingobium sp. BL-8H TaxID=3127640 RepID=UPI00375785DA
MQVSRRGVLIGALAGGGLAVGYLLRPHRFPLPLEPGPDEYAFGAWIKIGADGVVSVAVPQVEMGQGVTTLLPQVVAWEMGADWRQIAVEPAPVSALYANTVLAAKWSSLWSSPWMPMASSLAENPDGFVTRRWAQDHRFNVTADGTALAAYEGPARAAAASARALLAQAAAARWGVAVEECEVGGGLVHHAGKVLPFGVIAAEAAAFSPPDPPPLRPDFPTEKPGEFPPGAKLRYPRLDLPSKVDGSWIFAGDVRLPDMLRASIRHAPLVGGKGAMAEVSALDEQAGKSLRGFHRFVQGPGWVAAVADDWWSAEAALVRARPRYRVIGALDSDVMDNALDEAMRTGAGERIHLTGDGAAVDGLLPFQVRYEVAPATHATIETASATARFADGRLELWIGTQAPEAVRAAAAEAVGVGAHAVVLYPVALGGSFDLRLECRHAAQVALLAKTMERPVQLTWPRGEEFRAAFPRTPAVAVMAARANAEGGIAGWRARIAAPASAREFGRRFFAGDGPAEAISAVAGKADPMALEGAVPAYAIPAIAVDHIPATIDLPTARMRGNAHGYTAFFNESFVDELAHRAGREPLSYRMAMLGGDPRLAECLQRVSALAEWGGGGDNSGQGIACHVIGGGRIAVIASARRDENGVRVDRLSAVADIGRIVNYDIARQQIEGGLVFGLGLTLGCAPRYVGGRPDSDRLGDMALPALADCPRIEVDFIESKADPADPGELGTAAVAPAVANALYSATGLRFRRLPLFAEEF